MSMVQKMAPKNIKYFYMNTALGPSGPSGPSQKIFFNMNTALGPSGPSCKKLWWGPFGLLGSWSLCPIIFFHLSLH